MVWVELAFPLLVFALPAAFEPVVPDVADELEVALAAFEVPLPVVDAALAEVIVFAEVVVAPPVVGPVPPSDASE